MGVISQKNLIWLFILLGVGLRLISLNQSLWLDEAINVLATQNYNLLGLITEYAKADFHPPGYFIILWFWTKFFGIGEVAVRIPSVIFGSITIYIVFLIGQKLHSRKLGLFCALLLAINPLHIYYSQEARMYALATLAVSISFFLFIKLIKEERISIIFLTLSNLLVLVSDYVAYFIFPSQLFFLLFFKQKEFFKKWLVAVIFAIVLGIWWIPVFLSQLNVGSVASSRLPAWKLIVGAFDAKAIPLTFVKFIIGRISHPDKLIYALILFPLTTFYSVLLISGVKVLKGKERNLIFSWLLIPIFFASVVSFFIPIYSYFRLLFVLPAFIILISLGVISFKSKLRYLFLGTLLTIQIFSTAVYLFDEKFHRDDWKGVVKFLKLQNKIVLFESSGTLPPFDYYARGEINARGALADFPAQDINDVSDLENILHKSKDVYLIEYLVDISDPNRLVAKRLAQLDYKLSETINFNGVGFVYLYKRSDQ